MLLTTMSENGGITASAPARRSGHGARRRVAARPRERRACRDRRLKMGFRALAGLVSIAFASHPALAADKVTFGINWLADPEAGGYYQALVDGTYAKYGLDVTIMQGGPQTNGGLYLLLGKIEFYMGGDMLGDFISAQQNLPTVAVAADFQKDPQAFMSHPGVGLDKWTDLPKATAFVSQTGLSSFYAWMIYAWGFSYDRVKPYNFNSGPFVADKMSIQQAYATSEP